MSRPLTVTFGSANSPAIVTNTLTMSWEALRQKLVSYAPETKDKASQGWYCGAEFSPAYRDSENFVARHFLNFDFDHIDIFVKEEIEDVYADTEYLLYTTWSHTEEKPRYRMLLPLSRPVTYDEFRAVSRKVADRLGIERMARESNIPSQMMFMPAVQPGAQFEFWQNGGQWIDVDAVLAQYADWTDRTTWPHRQEGDGVQHHGKGEDPRTKPGIIGAFCRAFSISHAIERFSLPYTPTATPGRWTFTRGSRPEGAIVYDSDLKMQSHHDTDPARGQHNAFDLCRLHMYGDLDKAVAADLPVTERPSFKAMCDLALSLPEVVNEIAKEEFEDLSQVPPPTAEEVKAQEKAERPCVKFTAGRPLGTAMEIARKAIDSVAEAIEVAVFGNRVVRPIICRQRKGFDGEAVESIELMPYEPTGFAAALARRVDFMRRGKADPEGNAKWVKVDCPPQVAKALLVTADKLTGIQIDRIAMTPILRGTDLHFARGHDRDLQAWLLAPTGVALPQAVQKKDAAAALARVQDWLKEFPFDTDLDRSAAISALLTAALRASLPHAPGILVSKPDYGSGASTFCDLIHVVLAGRPAAVVNASAGRGEVDKAIDSVQLAGVAAIVIDNVVDGETFNSIALAQVLTQANRQVRVLGESRVVTVPCTQMALVNGNNIRIADDLVRRFLRVRLDPHMESPHTRTFNRPDIITDALNARAQLLTDLYTIVIGYRQSGTTVPVQALAGFGGWSQAVAAPLVWLGLPDPTETQKSIASEDEKRADLRQVLQTWRLIFGSEPVTLREVMDEDFAESATPRSGEDEARRHELRQAIVSLCAGPRGGADPRKLGKWLAGMASRVAGGLCFEEAGGAHGNVKRWRVRSVEKIPDFLE